MSMLKMGWDKLRRFLASNHTWTGIQTFINAVISGGTVSNTTITNSPISGNTGSFTALQQTTGAALGKIPESDASGNLTFACQPKQNLLSNSGSGAWSNGTLENVGSNLITGWTNSGGGYAYSTFTSSGPDITSAIAITADNNAIITSNTRTSIAGKIYKSVVNLTLNSGPAPILKIYNGVNGLDIINTQLSAGINTIVYEETTTGNTGTVVFNNAYQTCDWSATVTLYEVTPGCVAADALGPDGTTKTSTLDILRTHQDTTHTKGFYGCKYIKGADGAEYHNIKIIIGKDLEQYKGRPVTFGMAGYSTTATDNLKIQIYDGVGTTESAFWAADALSWKEVTRTVNAAATELTFRVLLDGDTSDVAYGSFFMAVNGSSIGEYNYTPITGERILCEANIALTGYTATTSAADAIINLEAASSGKIPKGCKAVLVKAYGKDSAAGDGVGFDVQSASGVEDGISVDTQVNNIRVQGQGWIKCDANGDIYFDHRGSGASALTVDIKVIGVEV